MPPPSPHSSSAMPRIPSSVKLPPSNSNSLTSSFNSFGSIASLFGLRRTTGRDNNNGSNNIDDNDGTSDVIIHDDYDDKQQQQQAVVHHHKRAERRESTVSAISMPEGLTDEDWLEGDDGDEKEDGYWNDTSGTITTAEANDKIKIRQEQEQQEQVIAHQDEVKVEHPETNSNRGGSEISNCHVQTIIDLKMQLAMESSAKDELYMKLKHSRVEKHELEQELCIVLEERNKLVGGGMNKRQHNDSFCDNKSLATNLTSSTTKSSSVNSSFTSSLNSSCRSRSNSIRYSRSFLNLNEEAATSPPQQHQQPALSNQDILTLLSENTFLLTENTNLTAENARLNKEMAHLRSSFRTYMERSGGGMIDAAAGKLLFGKQKRSNGNGRSGVRRGSSSNSNSGGNDAAAPSSEAPTSGVVKPQSIIKKSSSFTTPRPLSAVSTSRSSTTVAIADGIAGVVNGHIIRAHSTDVDQQAQQEQQPHIYQPRRKHNHHHQARRNPSMLPSRVMNSSTTSSSMSSSSSSSCTASSGSGSGGGGAPRSCMKRNVSLSNNSSSSKSSSSTSSSHQDCYDASGGANEEWGVIGGASTAGCVGGTGGTTLLHSRDTGVNLLRRLSCSSSSLHPHLEEVLCESTDSSQ